MPRQLEQLFVDTVALVGRYRERFDDSEAELWRHLEALLDAARPVTGTVVALPLGLAAAMLAQLAHCVARAAVAVEAAGGDARALRVRIDHLHHERDKLVTRLLHNERR